LHKNETKKNKKIPMHDPALFALECYSLRIILAPSYLAPTCISCRFHKRRHATANIDH